MTKAKLQIHSENILPIIKRWLYSDHDIFARELIANANDAIHKLKILRDQGQASATDDEFKIDVTIDKEKKTITFSDTGIGMDSEEVVKYIAQIAFSGAEEFVEKYKDAGEKDQIIGHFGLGFYSSYMVAEKVELQTLSYKAGAKPVFWSCDGSPEYVLEAGTRDKRGTDVILYVSEENKDFLEEARLKEILTRYCRFLPHPISLNGKRVNEREPLWIKGPSECQDKDYLDFYHYLYPFQPDPLFWLHLNVDYPFHLKGILYFPKLQRNMDFQKQNINLYCNRVFVSENCKDVVPEFLLPLQGIIDSPDIPLNVSRSSLQTDRTVKQLSSHISKKVADSLVSLYTENRDRYIESWEDISIIVKIGAIENDKFYERIKTCLIWKTSSGTWMTIEEYLEKHKEKILYTTDETHHAHLLEVYRTKGTDVLVMNHPVDSYVIDFLERQNPGLKFQRIDAAVDEHLLDTGREKTILDAEGKTEGARVADTVRSLLEDESVDVEAKSLTIDQLPLLITIDENQRRMRDYMRSMNGGKMDWPQKKTLVVNTNSPLINAIQKLNHKNPALAKELMQETYQLALLSQREMDPKDLSPFIQKTTMLLEKLVQQVL